MVWNGGKNGTVGICGVRKIGVLALTSAPKNHRMVIPPDLSMTTSERANCP
jgi:hypothetical protein